MKLLCRDSDFATESEFSAVCKPRRGIDVNCRAVYRCYKIGRGILVFRDDCIAVMRRMGGDMSDGFLYVLYDFYGKNII